MARKQFYAITNAASEEATLSIFDEIGFWGTNAADFARELKAVTAPVINLEINSPGGSVFDGVAIYNLLRASGKTINATVMGLAASIASVILMAADKITMPANTMLMVHAPSGGLYGTADEMREMADVLDKVETSLVATYVKRTGMPEADVRALLATDSWLTAAEAKEKGFADVVTDSVELTASFDLEDAAAPEAARTAFKAAADKRAATAAKAKADKEAADKAAADKAAAEAEAAARNTHAAQVTALLAGTGFEAHAAAWAVKYEKPEQVSAQIVVAREIKALFALAKHDDKADALIAKGSTVAEARTELQNVLAAADQHIDTSRPAPGSKDAAIAAKTADGLRPVNVYGKRAAQATAKQHAADTKGPSAGSTAGVWAARNK